MTQKGARAHSTKLIVTQKLGSARGTVGPVQHQESLVLLPVSGKSSHTARHLCPVLWGSGPDTAWGTAWGTTLAAPVKNNQCAQGDEHQAGQPQADEVALHVVQGARACRTARERGLQLRNPQSGPALWVSNLQGETGDTAPSLKVVVGRWEQGSWTPGFG